MSVQLTAREEALLKEILEHVTSEGYYDLDYWDRRFAEVEMNYAQDALLRGTFGKLQDHGVIDVHWGDDRPCDLEVLYDGLTYFEEEPMNQTSDKPTLFVSYNQASGSSFVDSLERKLEGKATVLRDKHSVEPWNSFTAFMDSIRDQDFAVLVITEQYLKSIACMYEVCQLMKEKNWTEKAMFAVLDGSIFDKKIVICEYWDTLYIQKEESAHNLRGAALSALTKELDRIMEIRANVAKFINTLGDTNCPPIYEVLDKIEERVNSHKTAIHTGFELTEEQKWLHYYANTKEKLSDKAKMILRKVNQEGELRLISADGGFALMIPDGEIEMGLEPRSQASLKEALRQLEQAGIVQTDDNRIYAITEVGYKVIRQLKIDALLD